MTDLEGRLRAAMESAVGSEQPPRNLIGLVRRRHRRHVARIAVAGAASAAVVAGLIPASARVLGHNSGPAAGHGTSTSTVYVSFDYQHNGRVVPINPATNRPGKPIHLDGISMAITPNGKTLYVTTLGWTIPVSTATNKPGEPIHAAGDFYIDPNGKMAYAAGVGLTPVNLVTNKPGKTIHLESDFKGIAFTPSGNTAYLALNTAYTSEVIPVNTVTNKLGKPIHIDGIIRGIAIPDGKTAYVLGLTTVTPVSTATNKPGKPIHLGSELTALLGFTPGGQTLYTGTDGTVIPISTATNKPGKPISIGAGVPAEEMVLTPDGKTAYVTNSEGPTGQVVPINTATNTPGKPIIIGYGSVIGITADGKTVYAAARNKVVPISTATNKPGKTIRLPSPYGLPGQVVTTP